MHIIGLHAADLIQECANAMAAKTSVRELSYMVRASVERVAWLHRQHTITTTWRSASERLSHGPTRHISTKQNRCTPTRRSARCLTRPSRAPSAAPHTKRLAVSCRVLYIASFRDGWKGGRGCMSARGRTCVRSPSPFPDPCVVKLVARVLARRQALSDRTTLSALRRRRGGPLSMLCVFSMVFWCLRESDPGWTYYSFLPILSASSSS